MKTILLRRSALESCWFTSALTGRTASVQA
jgi:hypothetical protein